MDNNNTPRSEISAVLTREQVEAFEQKYHTENKQANDALSKLENQAIVSALSVVLTYAIADAFSTTMEESMWIEYQMNDILAPLAQYTPVSTFIAVKQELMNKMYSEKLMTQLRSDLDDCRAGLNPPTGDGKDVRYALLQDWAQILSEAVLTMYPHARQMIKTRIIGTLYGLLEEIGVTNDPKTSRKSTYLPTAVRYALGATDNAQRPE